MDKLKEILIRIKKTPLHELTFDMLIQLQKIDNMYNKNENIDEILEEINKFEEMEKLNIFSDRVSYTEHYKAINLLNKKILDVEKINCELFSQINEIKIDHIYLENDINAPSYGTILVYRKEQDFFYIIPYKYLNKTFSKISFESNQIIGWYYSKDGWQNISIYNDNLCLNPSIIDNKTIIGSNSMSIISFEKSILVIFKNLSIIPIFSSLEITNKIVIDNNKKHKVYIYCDDKINYYLQILKYIFIEINKWNINENDIKILKSIFENDMTTLSTISSEELLQPLHNSTILTQYFEEDLYIWNSIKEQLLLKTKIENLDFMNVFSRSALNYLEVKLELTEYKYNIDKLLIDFPIRINKERKLDFWINILKYIKNLDIQQLFNTNIIDILTKIKYTPLNGFFKLNTIFVDNYYEIWINIVLRNLNNYSLKKQLELISNYLIDYNSSNLNQQIQKSLNEIIVSLYQTGNFISLITNLNILFKQLDLHIDASFYDEILCLYKSQKPCFNKLKETLFYFINNEYILTTIYSINFEILFIYGILNIMKDYGNYEGINVKLLNSNMIWNDNGLIIKSDFTNTGSLEVDIIGNIVGFGKLTIENNTLESYTNLFISNIDHDFPDIFNFMYNYKSKKLYFRHYIYTLLLENIELNNHLFSKIYHDKRLNHYYVLINIFPPGKPIKINLITLYTYLGDEFIPTTNDTYYENIIKIQSKQFFNKTRNIFNN
jgi:hypothetical protein